MSTASAAGSFRAALVALASSLNPSGVLITRGPPAFDVFDDCISIGAVVAETEPATYSASLRSREETLTCPVTILVWRQGGDEQESIVEAAAYAYLTALETAVRVTDTTLGGIVRYCFLTSHAGEDVTPADLLSKGRLHVIEATFTAVNRISGS